MNNRKLKVFLCHGSEDKNKVRQLYLDLREDGADPWLDEKNILPGQDWDSEIKKAVKQSDVILVCLSSKSVSKEGYIQKEIKFALDVADEKPDGMIFVVPVKLEECNVPERLAKWQWVNLMGNDGYERIIRALRKRGEGLGLTNLPGDGELEIFNKPIEEESGRVLYKSRNIRSLLEKAKNGQLFEDDIPIHHPEQVIGITVEAMEESLSPFSSAQRREQEKEKILRFVGIRKPYFEWQEKNAKTHCFRNEPDDNQIEQKIEMVKVSSSNISAIGYDLKNQKLVVEFLSGAIYEYYGIPKNLHLGLMNASSHGKFLNSYIKVPSYPYKQIR